MSTIKVDTINTRTGSGDITFSRPIVADISSVTGTLPMARLSGTLPALNGSALTNLPDQSATDIKFSAAMSAIHSNVTGAGAAWYTNSGGVSWATPIINSGNGFSGGLFTCLLYTSPSPRD